MKTLMALAVLVMSTHPLHDGFEVLRWEEGGIGPGLAGLLWSEGVLAEVVVFVVVGPTLLRGLGPAGAATLAADRRPAAGTSWSSWGRCRPSIATTATYCLPFLPR